MGIHGLWVEISLLNIFWQKKCQKKYLNFLFQYLENEPLNVLNLFVNIIYGKKNPFFKNILKKKKTNGHLPGASSAQ